MEDQKTTKTIYQVKIDIIGELRDLADETKREVLDAVGAFYNISPPCDRVPQKDPAESYAGRPATGGDGRSPAFSDHKDQSPKQFLEEKQPNSDVDRVSCLAYYLANYRNTRHFKTVDISRLNTEAAQFKFSNAAAAVNNAALRGLLTSAGNGNKQISAIGEKYVEALPDKSEARKVLNDGRSRRSRGKGRRQPAEQGTTT